jgi:hypothetical protein
VKVSERVKTLCDLLDVILSGRSFRLPKAENVDLASVVDDIVMLEERVLMVSVPRFVLRTY